MPALEDHGGKTGRYACMCLADKENFFLVPALSSFAFARGSSYDVDADMLRQKNIICRSRRSDDNRAQLGVICCHCSLVTARDFRLLLKGILPGRANYLELRI